MACDRYQISDRAGAAITTSTLKDHRLIDEDDQSLVIDRNTIRRQKATFRKAIREEETNLFKLVDGIYVIWEKGCNTSYLFNKLKISSKCYLGRTLRYC